MTDKGNWDFKKYKARFCHITVGEKEYFLFKHNDSYFFSDEQPSKGEPVALPKGYKVIVDKKTNTPQLKEEKSTSSLIDDFFANESEEEHTKKEKKKKKLSSETHDKYHHWKY